MFRTSALLAIMVAAGSLLGIEWSHHEPEPRHQSDLDALKEQRIQLLQERVETIKSWVEQGRVGDSELIRPEIDVINARLDYAESDAERKRLLSELLKKYDFLVELAELQTEQPPRPESGNPNQQLLAESELLHLKSERVRIQILHDMID